MVKMANFGAWKWPELISRKIWVPEKSWKFYIVYSQLGCPGLYLYVKDWNLVTVAFFSFFFHQSLYLLPPFRQQPLRQKACYRRIRTLRLSFPYDKASSRWLRHQYSLFYTKTGLDGRLGKKAPFIVLLSPRFRKLDPLCFYFNGKLSCLTFPEEMSKRHYDSCWIDFENFFTDRQSILFFRQLIIVRSKVEREVGWFL